MSDDTSEADAEERDLVFATSVSPPSLHPYQEQSDARLRISPLMYDTLVEWDDDLQPIPGLAEAWDVEEDAIIFHLRDDATFHDGSMVTAGDVIYSLEQAQQSAGAGNYAPIQEMIAEDDHTLRLEFSGNPTPLLTALGGRYAFIAPEGADDDYNLDTEAMGSGAYQLVDYEPSQSMTLQRNDEHWRAEDIGAEQLIIRFVEDESSIAAGLRSGSIHAALFEDVQTVRQLEDVEDVEISEDDAVRWDVLDFPMDTAPFDDVNFRRAVSLALDRQAIMDLAIDGRGSLLGGHPPALGGELPLEEAEYGQRDLERAEELLEESAYNGEPVTLTSIQGFDSLNAASQVMVDNLSDVGIDVDIQTVELGVWAEEWDNMTFDTFTMNSWGGFVEPNLLYYNHYHQPPEGNDPRRWDDDEASRLIEEGRQTVDEEDRQEVYLDLQRHMAEQLPTLPLYSASFVGAQRPEVANWSVHPSGHYHDLRWIGFE